MLLDDFDLDKYSKWKWTINNSGYLRRTLTIRKKGKKTKFKTLYLHRLIMNPPKNMEVDHVNGNKLDNRKGNLRIVTRSINLFNGGLCKRNTSGVRGVYFNKHAKKWMVRVGGKYIGVYDKIEEAKQVYESIIENIFSKI